jgi:hypothetical protein
MRNALNDISRSMQALPDFFARLLYLASLRDQEGKYQHWGLQREYGPERTAEAYERIHRAAYESLLETSFSELMEVLKDHCAQKGAADQQIIEWLLLESAVKPAGIEPHSAMHFSYVLASLLALSQSSC